MANGGTVEELDAQRVALELAIVKHNQVIQDAEQQSIKHPNDPHWPDVCDLHRGIVNEYVVEIRLIDTERAGLPRPRRPAE